jgi:hypothetical protein
VSEHDKKTESVISLQLEQLSLYMNLFNNTVTFTDQSQVMFFIKVILLSSLYIYSIIPLANFFLALPIFSYSFTLRWQMAGYLRRKVALSYRHLCEEVNREKGHLNNCQ